VTLKFRVQRTFELGHRMLEVFRVSGIEGFRKSGRNLLRVSDELREQYAAEWLEDQRRRAWSGSMERWLKR